MKNFLNYIKQIFLAWLILLVIFIATFFSSTILGGILRSFTPTDILETVAIIGIRSPYFWLIFLFLVIIIMFFPVLFSIYVFKDSRKISAERGVKTSPYLWAIGVILPTVIFIFPFYLINRNIIWIKKINNN